MARKSLMSFDWSNDTLTDALRELPAETKREVAAAIEKTTDRVLASTKAKTPVASGRARAAWRKTVDPSGLVGRVTNGLPYIQRLEDGQSKQAPRGMLGPALKEADPKLRAELEEAMERVVRKSR